MVFLNAHNGGFTTPRLILHRGGSRFGHIVLGATGLGPNSWMVFHGKSAMAGGFHKKMGVPQTWMVFVRENPIKISKMDEAGGIAIF